MNRTRITRQDVLDAVRDHPGSTVDRLAEITGGTRLGVEQHLIRASGAGQVENRGGKGGNRVPGAWHLTAPVALPWVNSVWALGVSP